MNINRGLAKFDIHIRRDDIFDYHTFRKCNIYLIIPNTILLDFLLTVKAATLIFISGCGSAISTAKEGKSGLIYNLVKSK